MILTILILEILTIIAIGLGFLKNYHKGKKIKEQLEIFEIKIFQDLSTIKSEHKLKFEELEKSINSKIENTKTTLIEVFEKTSININNNIQTSNLTLQTEFQKTLDIITKFISESENEIKLKIENSLKYQELQQIKSLDNVEQKFQKIIDEIKSPLSLD